MPSPSLTLLRTQSDDRLVALARDGHERAFEAIVERYRRPLLRAARRVLPEGRAEDALQQALLSAWAAMGRGDEIRDLRPWLFRIVHNCSLNALRVSGYDYDELEDTLRITDHPSDELERRAVVRQTLTSLAALPDRQRAALLRTAVSGYSNEQVARELGVSDNALRQLVHRARCTMRAAATAVTPMPLVFLLVTGGTRVEPFAQRIAEATAGTAPAGAAAMLAKAGTVAVVATGVLTGPAIVDRVADRPQRDRVAAAATVTPGSPAASRPAPAAGARPHGTLLVARRDRRTALEHTGGGRPTGDHRVRRGGDEGRGREDPGRGGDDGESHSGRGGGEDSPQGGSGGSGRDDGGGGSSGSGSGGEDGVHSGGGSGSSGEDLSHSGSGSSASDDGGLSSASGTSGSGSSGSGSGSSGGGESSGSGDGREPVTLELPATVDPAPASTPAADSTVAPHTDD